MFEPDSLKRIRTTLIIMQNWAHQIARVHCDDEELKEFMYDFAHMCSIQHAELERNFPF